MISDKSLPLSVLLLAQRSMRQTMHRGRDNWEFVLQKHPGNLHRVNKKEFIIQANVCICSPYIKKVSKKHRFSKFHFHMASQPTAEGPASVRGPQPATLQPDAASGSFWLQELRHIFLAVCFPWELRQGSRIGLGGPAHRHSFSKCITQIIR